MSDLPPDWAIDVACRKLNAEFSVGHGIKWRRTAHSDHSTVIAFARYIAAHEEAPVDPCVVAGRKLVAETQHDFPDSPWHVGEAEEIIAGRRDSTLVVKAAVEGVRRGIELANTQPSNEGSVGE